MSENNIVRRYRFSDAELKQSAVAQIALIQRDISDFSRYGFNATAQAEYQTALDVFYDFPSDDILESQKMVFTANKTAARNTLEQEIRLIQHLVTLAFPNQPAYQRAFGDTYISRQSDIDLVETGLTVLQSANKYIQNLQSFGIGQLQIDAFKLKLDSFTTAYHKQKEAIHDRDIHVSRRIEAGNALYAMLVKYAGLAQVLFHSKSDPRRNDYVIYDSQAAETNNNIPPLEDSSNSNNDANNNSTTPPNRNATPINPPNN